MCGFYVGHVDMTLLGVGRTWKLASESSMPLRRLALLTLLMYVTPPEPMHLWNDEKPLQVSAMVTRILSYALTIPLQLALLRRSLHDTR
jgi:hypothetical protein